MVCVLMGRAQGLCCCLFACCLSWCVQAAAAGWPGLSAVPVEPL